MCLDPSCGFLPPFSSFHDTLLNHIRGIWDHLRQGLTDILSHAGAVQRNQMTSVRAKECCGLAELSDNTNTAAYPFLTQCSVAGHDIHTGRFTMPTTSTTYCVTLTSELKTIVYHLPPLGSRPPPAYAGMPFKIGPCRWPLSLFHVMRLTYAWRAVYDHVQDDGGSMWAPVSALHPAHDVTCMGGSPHMLPRLFGRTPPHWCSDLSMGQRWTRLTVMPPAHPLPTLFYSLCTLVCHA